MSAALSFFRSKQWDIRFGKEHDLTDRLVLRRLISEIRRQRVLGVIMDPPLRTFSTARDRQHPVRTRHQPWGLHPSLLSESEEADISNDNRCLRTCLRIIQELARFGIPYLLAHPASSKILRFGGCRRSWLYNPRRAQRSLSVTPVSSTPRGVKEYASWQVSLTLTTCTACALPAVGTAASAQSLLACTRRLQAGQEAFPGRSSLSLSLLGCALLSPTALLLPTTPFPLRELRLSEDLGRVRRLS